MIDLTQNHLIPSKYLEMTEDELKNRVVEVKAQLGEDLFLPAHHYQKDEVVQFADVTGDSLELANFSRDNAAKYIVFNGVHFMAETADMLTKDEQIVLLPDLRAGCSMADMANIHQVEKSYDYFKNEFGIEVLPLTYVNSTAAIKAFVGRHGGACLTSGNAHKMVKWALDQDRVMLFLPDQHLGRNTSYDLGVPLEQMAVYDPIKGQLEYDGDIKDLRVILWKGHCSVHEKFTVKYIEYLREHKPDMKIIVHPECPFEVVQASDENGSTRKIIQTIENSPAGSKWAVGTEMNLVNRLIQNHPDKEIISLNPYMCPCLTMNRIDLPHLVWCLDKILEGDFSNQITVDAETTKYALAALDRMLAMQ